MALRSVSPSLLKLTSSLRLYSPKLRSNLHRLPPLRRRAISATAVELVNNNKSDNKIITPAANQSADEDVRIVLPTNQSSAKLLRIRHTVISFLSFYNYISFYIFMPLCRDVEALVDI